MYARMFRILLFGVTFTVINLNHISSNGGKALKRAQVTLKEYSNVRNVVRPHRQPPPSRMEYHFMLTKFKSLSPPGHNMHLSPSEIASKYRIPLTPRKDLSCNTDGTTTIGWIPSDPSHGVSNQSSGLIPRFIFQSWKTNNLTKPICDNAVAWSLMNPEYDYFLFDDAAVDRFIEVEYGKHIFEAYACINVGAGKIDVWRLLVIYLFGGIYFDLDCRPKQRFSRWRFDNHTVVTGKPRPIFGNGAHQWGLIYIPHHPVIHRAIETVLDNLWQRTAKHVYEIGFNAYGDAWVNGPYNQSHMPGWGPKMGGRVIFQQEEAKAAMEGEVNHWRVEKDIWGKECGIREFDA